MPNTLWAVYEQTNGRGPIVWPLRRDADGAYSLVDVPKAPPSIDPLPVNVYRTCKAATLACARLAFDCAGTA
jgi:hypothetical protein